MIIQGSQTIRSTMAGRGISPVSLLDSPETKLKELGFNRGKITRLRHYRAVADEEISKIQARKIHLIFREEPQYPPLLREIYCPPDYLYVDGNPEVLQKTCLSVVGARKSTRYGLAALERILVPVIRAGLVIVSGMAYGMDTRAHQLALRYRGETIGVNPGGLLNLYPRGNSNFLADISRQGCIVSEFPMATVPRPFLFPVRNRIISGLSRALLVGEAGLKSGTLITADYALEQNRDIYAIPGPIDSPTSRGTNRLIQAGAKPILTARDILEEFHLPFPEAVSRTPDLLSDREKKLLDLTDPNSVKGIDYFVEKSNLSVPVVIATLLGLKLKGLVNERQGGYLRTDEEPPTGNC